MRNFIQKFISMNRSNRKFKNGKAEGLVLHETATPGATAENEFSFFNSRKVGASAHAFIDWKQDLQLIPWDEVAWHAKNPANEMFLGLEMCRPLNGAPDRLEKMKIVYQCSVEATARLYYYVLNIKKVTKENTMSHDEVRIKWGKTSHVDPTSYLKEIGKNMDMFRAEVQEALDAFRN